MKFCDTLEDVMLHIKPVAKGRPRATGCGGYVRMFTPQKTQQFESEVAEMYAEMGGKKHSGPLEIEVRFYFAPNKSETKKNRTLMLTGEILHTKKPDVDNCIKSLMDGLNGVAYDDDSQIVKITATKSYAEQDGIRLVIYGERNGQ